MPEPLLLAHIAKKFVPSQHENIASESLAYVLRRSSSSRAALIHLLRSLGARLPEDLTFRTQAHGTDEAIPDIAGEDVRGIQTVILEAKFWAGLTESQPVGYIQRLRDQGGTTLVVIAPSQRAELLWTELTRRCAAAGIGFADSAPRPGGV